MGSVTGKRIPGLGPLLLASLFGLAGCYTVPETGRSSFTLLPESQVVSMGLSSFEQIKAEEPLITSGPRYEMIQRVGNRVADAVGDDLPAADWEFIYIDRDEVNAFALPGGKVAVYDGLFEAVENEDQLAFVLGHEVAHVTARHANQRLSQAMVVAGVGSGLGYAIDDLDPAERQIILAAYGVGATVGVALPYSRMHESEADVIGQIYMARAGYDPREAPQVWENMAEVGGAQPPEFLSTHPSYDNRTERLEENVPRAERQAP